MRGRDPWPMERFRRWVTFLFYRHWEHYYPGPQAYTRQVSEVIDLVLLGADETMIRAYLEAEAREIEDDMPDSRTLARNILKAARRFKIHPQRTGKARFKPEDPVPNDVVRRII